MLQQMIEKKLELEQKRNHLQLSIKSFSRIEQLSNYAALQREKVEILHKEKNKPDSGVTTKQLEEATLIAKDAKERLEAVYSDRDRLETELDNVTNELQDMKIEVKENDLLEIQSIKEKSLLALAEIEAIIAKLSKINNNCDEGSSQLLKKLTLEKETILAEIELGTISDKVALKELEEKITTEEQKHSNIVDSAIEDSHAIAGLQKKQTALKDKLNILEKVHLELFKLFMNNRIERLGQHYADHAQEVIQAYLKIQTLSDLLRDLGGGGRMYAASPCEMEIPRLAAIACLQNGNGSGLSYMYSERFTSTMDARKMTFDELKGEGIHIPCKPSSNK